VAGANREGEWLGALQSVLHGSLSFCISFAKNQRHVLVFASKWGEQNIIRSANLSQLSDSMREPDF
jgi:hypothetical protein